MAYDALHTMLFEKIVRLEQENKIMGRQIQEYIDQLSSAFKKVRELEAKLTVPTSGDNGQPHPPEGGKGNWLGGPRFVGLVSSCTWGCLFGYCAAEDRGGPGECQRRE